jgi:hypothetical protein
VLGTLAAKIREMRAREKALPAGDAEWRP